MLRFAHIVNPVKVSEEHELFEAQKWTFESMIKAKESAVSQQIEVKLLAAAYDEDLSIIPKEFQIAGVLQKNISQFVKTEKSRKLPLIGEIIQLLLEKEQKADFYIFTNVDIILSNDFYVEVAKIIQTKNIDGLIINRKNIKEGNYNSLREVFQAKSSKHPGFDCFVVKNEILRKFIFNNICVGVPFIGVNFAHNVFCFAKNPVLLDNENLTRHIGEDIFKHKRGPYYWHNRKCFDENIKEIWQQLDIDKFPYSQEFFIKKYYKWGMNPSLFTFMNFKLSMRKLLKGY